jgi:chromate transporter
MPSPTRLWETFSVTLRLGLTSFGGPIAHLGYFENTYVRRLNWLTPQAYGEIVALCQLLPGPASSQANFLIGWQRAGAWGALLSWIGFTLPSALLMYGLAVAAPHLNGPLAKPIFHALKLVAVCVVAQAVWSMGRKLCPDAQRLLIAAVCGLGVVMIGGVWAQVGAIAVAAIAGLSLCRATEVATTGLSLPISRNTGLIALGVFAVFMVGLPFVASHDRLLGLIDIHYRAGALVFGGGHVVLPLLHEPMVANGLISDADFLSGYGGAQAVPGPLFTLAAYLGAMSAPAGAAPLWALSVLIALSLPGLLLAIAGAPLWAWIRSHPAAQTALMGINAGVVGILAAALYSPVGTSAILSPRDALIAVAGVFALERLKTPPLMVVGAIIAICVAGEIVNAVV